MKRFLISALILLLLAGCKNTNVTTDDSLKSFFDSAAVTGCFGLFNNSQNNFIIYNLPRYRDSSFTPASTFKVVISLIGIQTGRISDENMVIKWDSVKRRPEWDKDLSMKEAFAVSSGPYYQEVARRIGHDTMKHWIDSLGYGNRDASGPVDSLWLNNTLKVKPDEELGLVKKLYFNQLPFFHRTQEIVKKLMLREQNSNYQLSYKTGWGNDENGNEIGWVVGWIEENKHPYFFVLNLESHDKNIDMEKVRLQVLKGILAHLGFFNGKK